MKKFLLGLGLAAAVALPAQAFTLENGLFTMHVRDATNAYDQNGNPVDDINFGNEVRSVFNIDDVAYNGGPGQSIPLGELSGIVSGLTAVGRQGIPGMTDVTVYFGAPAAAPGVYSTGGVFRVFNDLTPEQANMINLVDPAGTGNGPAQWTSPTDFPNITEAEVFWDGVFVTSAQILFDAEGDIIGSMNFNAATAQLFDIYLADTFFLMTPGAGHSQAAYVDVIGGTGFGPLVDEFFTTPLTGQPADLTLQFDLRSAPDSAYTNSFADVGGWNTRSFDPIEGAAENLIPEPASMTLLGLALAGLVGYRRRQK